MSNISIPNTTIELPYYWQNADVIAKPHCPKLQERGKNLFKPLRQKHQLRSKITADISEQINLMIDGITSNNARMNHEFSKQQIQFYLDLSKQHAERGDIKTSQAMFSAMSLYLKAAAICADYLDKH
ncbi:hypothetical protein [Shewanella marina]|uniref:hypothetical protein n=1 Tax=Shewanella marina TaxID=487319 RepID=UPI00046ECE0C|nr:hypothetical protein [Shewanella marina]